MVAALSLVAACGGASIPSGGSTPAATTASAAATVAPSPASTLAASPQPNAEAAASPSPVSTSVIIELTSANRFQPAQVTVPRGTKVTFRNNSGTVQTVTDDPAKVKDPSHVAVPSGGGSWDAGQIQPGAEWSDTFDAPGTFTFVSLPHEDDGMIGSITVQE